MKKNLLFTAGFIFILAVRTSAQFTYNNAFSLGNNASDQGTSIASDASGNFYVAGTHTYWMDLNPLGTATYISNNGVASTDIYLAKYSPLGILIWGFDIGGSGDETVSKVILDNNNNIYITGSFNDSVDFDPGTGTDIHVSKGGRDIFLAKYDNNGTFQWANTFGDSLDEVGYDITIGGTGASGYIAITGGYKSHSMDMDPAAGTQLIVNNGNVSFNTGNCFVAAYYDSDGSYKWAFNIGGFGGATGFRITTDVVSGNIYVAGEVSGDSTDFDPGNGTSYINTGNSGMVFLAKYDPLSNFIFVKSFGGVYGETANSLATDDAGNVYMGGYFNSDSMDVDPGPGTYYLHNYPGGVQDIYLAKFDTIGALQWAFAVGGYYSEVAQDLVVDNTGHLFITGNFGDTVDFDPGPSVFNLTGQLGSDAYLAEYDFDGHFIDAIPFNGNGTQFGIGLSIIPNHKIGVTGLFSADTIDFDPGPAVHNLFVNGGSQTWTDAFVAVYDYMVEGIEEATKASGLTVFPNPSGNFVTVSLKNSSAIDEITVTNILGENVFHSAQWDAGKTHTKIDCSDLQPGIYFVVVKTKEGIETSKFVRK